MVVVVAMAIVGVGIDLVEIARAREMLQRKGDQALAKVLTAAERRYVESREYPEQHFAARFAAKEAVYKALQSLSGSRVLGWHDIEVVSSDSGRPLVELHGAARELADRHGISLTLSLTHTSETAGAVAVAESQVVG